MLLRYLKAQLMVLLCGGLVGPIFLIVYFALGTMARPYINWMFWVGLLVTAIDVLVALALTSFGAKSAARHEELARSGVRVMARVTAISDTSWFVNDQQMIKVTLHFDVPGQPSFEAQETMASSPARMQILNGRTVVALVEPGTQNYEIDWDASGSVGVAVPTEPVAESVALTVSQRLQQLETLRATGAVTEAEYTSKRQQILADL